MKYLLLATFALPTLAADVQVSWDHSTNAPAEIAGYELRYGFTSTNKNKLLRVGYTNSAVITNFREGIYIQCYAVSPSGLYSLPSNELYVPAKLPAAPSNLRINVVVNVTVSTNP